MNPIVWMVGGAAVALGVGALFFYWLNPVALGWADLVERNGPLEADERTDKAA